MALSARELMLIVRASNQASGALRRIAGDVRGLSALEGAKLAKGRIAAQQMATMGRIDANRAKQADILAGKDRESMRLAQERMALTSKYNNNLRDQQTQMGKVARESQNLKEATKRLKDEEKKLDQLRGKQAKYPASFARQTRNVENAAKSLQGYERSLVSAANGQQKLQQEMRMMPGQFAMHNAAVAESNARLQTLRAEEKALMGTMGELQTKMKGVRKEISQHRWANFEKGAATMRHMGKVMAVTGAIGIGALGLMSKGAADFETQMNLVGTQSGKAGITVQKSLKNSATLGKAVLKQMKQFPATSQEMSDSLYEFFSSTTQGKEGAISLAGGIKLLALANKAAVAGQAPLADSTTAIISLMNHFGLTVGEIPKKMDAMFAAVRFGKMHFGELSKSLENIGPAALAAGASLESILAAFAFGTTRLGAAKARVGVPRLLEMFSNKDFIAGLKKSGVQIVDSTGKLKDFDQIIGMLVAKFPKLRKGGVAATNFFKEMTALGSGGKGQMGTIQGRRLLQVMTANFGDYSNLVKKMKNDHGEFAKSWSALAHSAGVRWGVFTNTLKSFAITIGQAVLPLIDEISGPIQRLTNWWNGLDESMRHNIVRWTAFISAGMLAVGLFGMLSGSILGIIGLIGRLSGFKGILAIFVTLAGVIAGLTGNFDALGSAAGAAADMMLGSWQGVLGTMALVAAAVLKFSKARGAAMAGGAAASGGLLPMLIGKGGGLRAAGSEMARAGKLAASFGGKLAPLRGLASAAATGIALIPGPLKLLGAALGATGAIAALYQMHMASVRAEMAKARTVATDLFKITAPQRIFAAQFQNTGNAIENFVLSSNKLRGTAIQIKMLKKELSGMKPGLQKEFLKTQLVDLQVQLAQSRQQVRADFADMTKSARAFGNALKAQDFAGGQRGKILAEIARQKKIADKANADIMKNPQIGIGLAEIARRAEDKIKSLTNALRQMDAEGKRSTQDLTKGFNMYIQKLQDLGPKFGLVSKLPANFKRDALAISKQLQRALSPKELRALVKLEIDPTATTNLPAKIQRIFAQLRAARVKIQVATDIAKGKKLTPEQLLGMGKGPVKVKKSVILDIVPTKKKKIDPSKFFTVGKFKLGGLGTALGDLTKGLGGKKGGKDVTINIHTNPNPNKVRSDIESAFHGPVPQFVNVGPGALGAAHALAGDLRAAFSAPIVQTVTINKTTTLKTVRDDWGIDSPSKVMAKEVGLPLAQGVAVGFEQGIPDISRSFNKMAGSAEGAARKVEDPLTAAGRKAIISWLKGAKDQMPNVEHLATVTIELFVNKIIEGKQEIERASITLFDGLWMQSEKMQKKMEKKKFVPSMGDLRKDLGTQLGQLRMFNNSIERLQKRHVPMALLNELRMLGVEGAKQIRRLAQASKKELDAYVRMWKRTQKEIERSQPKLTMKDLIGGMRQQAKELHRFNQALLVLTKRKVPLALLKQLQELGTEGVMYIMMLSHASKKELAAFVKWWKKAQAEIARTGFIDPEAAGASAQAAADKARDTLEAAVSLWRDIATTMGENFGQLFAGGIITGIQDMNSQVRDAIAGLMEPLGHSIIGEFFPLGSPDYERQLHDYNETLYGLQQQRNDVLHQLDEARNGDAEKESDERAKIETDAAKRILKINQDLAENIAQAQKDLAQSIQDAQTQFAVDTLDRMKEAFGGLFANIQDDIPTLKEALDEATSQFGTFFQGIYLQSEDVQTRLEWGQVLNFDDLKRDLQSQLTTFASWRAGLNTLLTRNIPAEMVQQLEALGPEANDKLQILVNATDAQLAEYVALWRQSQTAIEEAAPEKIDLGKIIGIEDLTKSLQDQVTEFGAWHDVMQELANKNIPQALINQLAQLGPEGMKYLKILNDGSAAQIAQFVAIWQTGQSEILDFSKQVTIDVLGEAALTNEKILQLWSDFSSGIITLTQGSVTDLFGLTQTLMQNIANLEEQTAKSILDMQTQASKDIAEVTADVATQLAELANNVSEAVSGAATDIAGLIHDLAEIDYQIKQLGAPLPPLTFQLMFAELANDVATFQGITGDILTIKGNLIASGFTNDDVRRFLAALAALGPEGANMIRLLANASAPELAAYVQLWLDGQGAIQAAQDATEIALSPEDLLRDLRAQAAAFQEWRNAMETIHDRNVPALLLQQLEALGPAALPMLRALNQMTDAQLTEFVTQWELNGESMNTATNSAFDTQIQAWREIGGDLSQAIIDGFAPVTAAIMAFIQGVINDNIGKPTTQTVGTKTWWSGKFGNLPLPEALTEKFAGISGFTSTQVSNFLNNFVGTPTTNALATKSWWSGKMNPLQFNPALTEKLDLEGPITSGKFGSFLDNFIGTPTRNKMTVKGWHAGNINPFAFNPALQDTLNIEGPITSTRIGSFIDTNVGGPIRLRLPSKIWHRGNIDPHGLNPAITDVLNSDSGPLAITVGNHISTNIGAPIKTRLTDKNWHLGNIRPFGLNPALTDVVAGDAVGTNSIVTGHVNSNIGLPLKYKVTDSSWFASMMRPFQFNPALATVFLEESGTTVSTTSAHVNSNVGLPIKYKLADASWFGLMMRPFQFNPALSTIFGEEGPITLTNTSTFLNTSVGDGARTLRDSNTWRLWMSPSGILVGLNSSLVDFSIPLRNSWVDWINTTAGGGTRLTIEDPNWWASRIEIGLAACFTGDTLVHTPSGMRKIEDIHPGDRIYCYNQEAMVVEDTVVTERFVHEDQRYLSVRLRSGGTLKVTQEHLVWNATEKKWTAIGIMNPGDKLLLPWTHSKLEIVHIEEAQAQPTTVYNLHVEHKDHNYLVGQEGVLVHNTKVGGETGMVSMSSGVGVGSTSGDTYHITNFDEGSIQVTANDDESLETTLNRMSFSIQNTDFNR